LTAVPAAAFACFHCWSLCSSLLLSSSMCCVLLCCCDSGYALRLQRLVLANIALPDPVAEAGIPRLWPLGLYAEPGSRLYMADVRLVVRDDAHLQRYVQFFQGENCTMVHYYTVRTARAAATAGQSSACLLGQRDSARAAATSERCCQFLVLLPGSCKQLLPA
jgi:hypothetical protein